MIDIHTHILPGVDDGAQTHDDAIAMARLALAAGTTVMFATPHVETLRDLARVKGYLASVHELQTALDAAQIPLQLASGAEVYPLSEIPRALAEGVPLTLGNGGRYLLLDSPFSELPHGFEAMQFSLQLQGYTPILAHPERIESVLRDPRILEPLIHRGLLLQITASSLVGKFGPLVEEIAFTLLRHHWVHFIASDAHSPIHRRPELDEAAKVLVETEGSDVVATLFEDNGRRVLMNDVIPTAPLPWTPVKKKRFFGLY